MASKASHFPLDISKLSFVLQVLRHFKFREARWLDFGLNLGLPYHTLKAIESANKGDPSSCLRDCLAKWLTEGSDHALVWQTLANALREMNMSFVSNEIRKTMADPVSEILQCYIGRLAQVVLTEESVDLLHTEGLISKDTLTEVKSCGCSLVGDPMLLILSAVAEDHSKLCTLTSILMKSKEAVALASDIIMEYEKSFPSAITVMPSCQQTSTLTSSRSGQLQDSSSETQVTTNTDATAQGVVEVIVHPGYEAEFNKMSDMLGTLINAVAPLIKAAIPSVDHLKTYLRRCRPELKPRLKDANCFDDVMEVIEDECSITNVALLETIVNNYSIQDAGDMILAYQTHLDEFCENKLTMFFNRQLMRLSSSLLTCETIKFVLKWKLSEHSFSNIAALLRKKFKDNQVEVVAINEWETGVSYPAVRTGTNSLQEQENIEKLKTNAAELTEEKLQLEKKLRSVNENLTKQNEELKAKVVEREIIIAKLVEEKSQLKEELQKAITTAEDNEKQLKEKEPVKNADIQFDYCTFPSMEETEKLTASIAKLTEEKSQLEEKNEKSTEKIEKLEAKVVDSQTYIATLTEEKILTNEEIENLRSKISDNDMQIAKLKKKESQLKEELQSIKNIPTDTKCIQCDYWTKAELPFDGMVTLGKKVCLYNANSSHELQLDECGLTLSLPDGLLSPVDSTVYEAAAQGLWGGDFEFPGGTHLISSVCYISVSPNVPELDKPVTVQLVHCAHLTSQSQSQYLSFVVAEVQPGKQCGPFKFKLVPGGLFSPESQTGTIKLKSFSLVAIVIRTVAAIYGIAGFAISAFTGVPTIDCLALIYKKCDTDKAMLSLAAIQNMRHLKKLINEDPSMQSLLGVQIRSIQFQFSDDKSLEVKGFPLDTIDGWKISPLNPTVISTSSVVNYSSSSAEPPYIQVSVEPDETGAADKLSHALSIEGIQVASGASSVPWNIKVSKNDLSHAPLAVGLSLVAATPTEQLGGVTSPAYKVMLEYASRIKRCKINLDFFTEKLLEKKIINNIQKMNVTDERSRCTTDQRMDELLDIIKETVKEEEEAFDYILDIFKDEGTILADKLHDDMSHKYQALKNTMHGRNQN